MRQAADVIGAMSPWRARHEEPSAFGAAEHDRQAAYAQHRALLERLRQQEDTPDTTENADEETPEHPRPEERVELVEEDDEAMRFSDPAGYAKHLSDQAELAQEQRGPVALLARDMQTVYGHELARRALLTDAQRRSESLDATDVVRLPLVGRRLRLLFYGGWGLRKDTDHQLCACEAVFVASTAPRDSSSMPSPTSLLD